MTDFYNDPWARMNRSLDRTFHVLMAIFIVAALTILGVFAFVKINEAAAETRCEPTEVHSDR